jgi:hypothetical protein
VPDFLREATGEAGIRTLGTLLGYNALAKRRFRPLSHLTNVEPESYKRLSSSVKLKNGETSGRFPVFSERNGVI